MVMALFVDSQATSPVVTAAKETIRDNPYGFYFISDSARSVGCWPLAYSNAALVTGSDETEFFGVHEVRVITAVSNRIDTFVSNISTPPVNPSIVQLF